LLFELEQQPFLAQFQLANSTVAAAEAQLDLASKNLERCKALFAKKGVSQEELDHAQAQRVQAEVQLKVAHANRDLAKLNLDATKVKSPINGRVGKALLTKGNVVHQFKTVLTTIVSLDPMHVDFEVDEVTLFKIEKIIKEGKEKLLTGGKIPVEFGMQIDVGYPHKGIIDFIDNAVNPAKGTISMRAAIPNKVNGGNLWPGMFVRGRMPISQPYNALLVSDQIIKSIKGQKYVLVVDAEKKVQIREVTIGSLQLNGLRVISKGLELDDLVVVGDFQQAKVGEKVQTKLTVMPMNLSK
jgi:RND family efflux transporter MFP subunit